MEFDNIEALERFLQGQVTSIMNSEMAHVVRNVERENIVEHVYDVYQNSPNGYRRRGTQGGLMDFANMPTTVSSYGDEVVFEMTNKTTATTDSSRNVAEVVETGIGYHNSIFASQIIPRPFVARTREELEAKSIPRDVIKDGLRRRGIDVE